MFKPLSLFIGLRYTRTRKHNNLISFVSIISMMGISLGVLTLIVVLSVINGSTTTMRNETLKSVPHVTISGGNISTQWPQLAQRALQHEAVIAAAPYFEAEASITYQGENHFVRIRGVNPEYEATVLESPNRLYRELLAELGQVDNGIVFGTQLAGRMGLYGSNMVSVTPVRSLLRRKPADARGFTVLGAVDFGFYGNDNIALMNLHQATDLFGPNASNSIALRLRVDDVFSAAAIADSALPANASDLDLQVRPWSETQASLFNALRMEKILTGFMLLMIVIIGAVNIVSTLVMVVADKGADIAILRTMGASRLTIMAVFILQGFIAGVFGTLIGAISGVVLAIYITDISLSIENFINANFADDSIYMISHLQSQLDWTDVMLVCFAALLVSLLATLYPAYRAAKVQPAEVLRYE